jgi:hypothetical protein
LVAGTRFSRRDKILVYLQAALAPDESDLLDGVVLLDIAVLKDLLDVLGPFGIVIIILWFHAAFRCGRIALNDGGGLSRREKEVCKAQQRKKR